MPERSSRRVLRDHVTREIDPDVGQASLRVRGAKDACPSDGREGLVGVVGDVERFGGTSLEAGEVVPGHVLDAKEGSVGDEDHVEGAVADDDVVGLLDDVGQGVEGGGFGGVAAVDEDLDGRAGCPGYVLWGVDGLLDVRAIKVDACAFGEVVETAGEAELVPEDRTSSGDLVDVEAGVQLEDGGEDVIIEGTAFTATPSRGRVKTR